MKIGTRSVLYGAHCWFIHPWFVAAAWWKLFGFPYDPRLWVAFFVHDLGYWGRPNMDGPEGEDHVWRGACVMANLFDHQNGFGGETWLSRAIGPWFDRFWGKHPPGYSAMTKGLSWFNFTFFHSRFMAKRYGRMFSLLCVADKLAVALEPRWLYLPRVWATGEVREYMAACETKYAGEVAVSHSMTKWHRDMTAYLREWVAEHKDMRPDTWTPDSTKGPVDAQ